jgi:hypothetical protein
MINNKLVSSSPALPCRDDAHPSCPPSASSELEYCASSAASINTTVLEVPIRLDESDNGPGTAMTTMTDVLGSAADQRLTQNREIVQQMRDDAESKLKPFKKKKKKKQKTKPQQKAEESPENIRHLSAMPPPLAIPQRTASGQSVRGTVKRMLSINKGRTGDHKPLPAIPDSGNPYDPSSMAYIPGAFIPSPITPQQHHNDYYLQPLAYNPQPPNFPYDSMAPPMTPWPLPNDYMCHTTSPMHHPIPPPEIHFAEPNMSSPLTARPVHNNGVILSHGQFISPTRTEGFASRLQPQINHYPISHQSLAASIVDPRSPSYMSLNTNSRPYPPRALEQEQNIMVQNAKDSSCQSSAETIVGPETATPAELDGLEIAPRRLRRTKSMPTLPSASINPADDPVELHETTNLEVPAQATIDLHSVHMHLSQISNEVVSMKAHLSAEVAQLREETQNLMRQVTAHVTQTTSRPPPMHGVPGQITPIRGGRRGGGSMTPRLHGMPPHIPFGGRDAW